VRLAVLQAAAQPPSCAANELLQYEREVPDAATGRWLCTAPVRATSPGGWCRADGDTALACDASPPTQLATPPPDCVAPRGLRLQYTLAGGWTCLCAPGYSGAACGEGSGNASSVTEPAACAPPPPCAPPAGTGAYSFDATAHAFVCVCAVGYSGAPCAA
jgi:hypothetical protein